ncbi:histidine kinase [Streptomyces sp. TS71-3]|uniref:sensor histidine kinase n=1 Tax=Streptomyces sp. TS71-3 TaxID=2733862 RepID=UPI001B209BD6|nr:histidine kinase [Streptomyces sp. TS71-3]GHJ35569.1 two-component sensor histidine kinase [Streptomyces sp. TS71-3]
MTTQAPWHRRHWVALDVAIAVAFTLLDTGLTLLGATWWPHHPGALAWVMLGMQALACGSLAVRRIAPLTVVGLLGAFTLAVTLLISPAGALTPAHHANSWAPLSTMMAAYGPLFYHPGRKVAFATLAAFTVVVMRPWDSTATIMTIGLLRTGVGPLLALYFDARRKMVLALVERAEREQHLLAERARAEERARLAGEMHDVVTHRVSLMVLQAGALRVTAKDEAVRQAAEDLRAAGCQALDELRDVVGILRAPSDGDHTPSVGGFDDLVAESVAVGIPTELIQEGDPALASPVVGRIAYRVLREALTNVRKHAPGARVTVRVGYEEAQLRLTVHNTAPASRPSIALAGSGSGLGIVHLRQRVELVHGKLRAGPGPDGGFNVEATLPASVPTAESTV